VVNRTSFPDRLVGPLLRSDTSGHADAIVVLGAGIVGQCGVNNNGLRRSVLAARLWHEGRAPVIVVTGGRPAGESCSVAEAQARLLRDFGVAADRILVETGSHNTHENAVLSDALLKRLGAGRLLVVTDRLHMTRAGGVFARLGYRIERASVPVPEGHPDNVSMLYAGFREFVAIAYYRWKGWLAPLDGPDSSRRDAPRAAAVIVQPVAWRSEAAVKETAETMEQIRVAHPDGPIVILGASYAAGWHPAVPGVRVVNKGVAGQQSFKLLERFDRDVVAERPRAVILWGFINDIFRAPKDGMEGSVTRARESFTTMIAAARAQGIEPIVATEVPIRAQRSWSEWIGSWIGWATGKTPYHAGINQRVRDTNGWLRELARREGLLLLDLEKVVADETGDRRDAFAKDDGSHIPPEGYTALTAYAAPILAEHLRAGR
jgi:uncharacterized SAM-binding protein YcdF (DUF218 family)/lysophospholipase L1-like esterase